MDKNKTVITKEHLIKNIANSCTDDFISMSDLINIIDEISDDYGFVPKKKLIKSIKSVHTKIVVRDIYNTFEHLIFQLLALTDKRNNISIKLFEGITLDGTYVPEKSKINNLTGKVSKVAEKIKPKFNITRSYCEKLNAKK